VTLKAMIPWPAKIVGKIVLSRLPIGYERWQRVSLFRHGAMTDPAYALDVFKRHFGRLANPRPGFVALELGPGDSVASAVIAAAHGASQTILVDVGPFARRDLEPYRELGRFLERRGLRAPQAGAAETFEELLKACSARYETDGLASLRRVPDASADLIWSHAVLEHVARSELPSVARELRRIVRDDGICSHCIDLKDHLNGGLNSLRFSERLWESRLFARSGFYTNRVRATGWREIFEAAGFAVDVVRTVRWESLPVPRSKLDPEFRSLPDDDLLVSDIDVILRPIG
jgi:SAM-dependent methyltransferase